MADQKISALTALTAPVDADVIPIVDDTAGQTKKITWAYIKSVLKTYFDGLYLALGGGTITGDITMGENTAIAYDPSLSADGKYAGITITGTAGTTLAFGDLITFDKDDQRWEKVDISAAAAATGDARGILGICVLAAANDGDATKILLHGVVRADANFPALTQGVAVYASTTGDIVVAQPTTTDHVIRIVGFAILDGGGATSQAIFFNPSADWITHI